LIYKKGSVVSRRPFSFDCHSLLLADSSNKQKRGPKAAFSLISVS